MSCNKADSLMMHYADKTIEPKDAKELAMHLLGCKNCRESFAVFDSFFDEGATLETPRGFVKGVMAKTGAHSAALAVRRRVLSALAAVLAGAGLLVAFVLGFGQGYVDSAVEIVGGLGHELFALLESLSQSLSASSLFGLFTFMFVPVLGMILFVLHNTEKSAEA